MSVVGAKEFTAEVKYTWLAALRSGDYKQGRMALREGECFCCLGVLADIVNDGKWKVLKTTKAFAPAHFPEIPLRGDYQEHLVGLNDRKRFTFEQIADVIEVMIPVVELS